MLSVVEHSAIMLKVVMLCDVAPTEVGGQTMENAKLLLRKARERKKAGESKRKRERESKRVSKRERAREREVKGEWERGWERVRESEREVERGRER
jgi:hypothetical protein